MLLMLIVVEANRVHIIFSAIFIWVKHCLPFGLSLCLPLAALVAHFYLPLCGVPDVRLFVVYLVICAKCCDDSV
jgi:hypothetical protein